MKEPTGKPSKAQLEQALAIAERMAGCQRALLAAAMPLPPAPPDEVAHRMVRKLAFEAYPQWSIRPSNQGWCPKVADLAEYMDDDERGDDPWGHPYVIQCAPSLPAGARGIAVSSIGPDGRAGTADDVRSWAP